MAELIQSKEETQKRKTERRPIACAALGVPASRTEKIVLTDAIVITEQANDIVSDVSDGVHESNDDPENMEKSCEDSAAP